MPMITSTPPDKPVLEAPAPEAAVQRLTEEVRYRQEITLGLANPEWLNLGYQVRRDQWGLRAAVGTLATAQSYTVAGRYFPWAWKDDWKKGLNVEFAVTMHQLAEKSAGLTPMDLWPLSTLSVGYDCVLGPMTYGISVGMNPYVMATGSRPLVSTNAAALPRLLLQVGYGF
jgi:hypothetical protein